VNQTSQFHPSDGKAADQFIRNAALGTNRWWGWILGTVSIVVIWQGIGAIPIIAACEYVKSAKLVDFTCEDETSIIRGASTLPAFVLTSFSFVVAMIGIWMVVRLLHKKSLTAMSTARPSFDYSRVLFAMTAGLAVLATPILLLATLIPEEIVFQSPDAWEYTAFFMLAIVLIAVQAGFEEIFFRGYLMQGFALLTRNKVALAFASAIVFTLPHLPNPEPWEYGVAPYIASIMSLALFFAVLTLLDGGIELATGIHVANNLVVSLVANTSVSALQTPALFMLEIDEYRLFPDILVLWLTLAIVLFILNRKYQWFRYRQLASKLMRRRN
jgi:membrane protease YdiL (CAAX protease family)